MVVDLSARDLVRSADRDYPAFVVALKNCLEILLWQDQERVLSAFPVATATTLSKIAVVTHMPAVKVAAVGGYLREVVAYQEGGRPHL